MCTHVRAHTPRAWWEPRCTPVCTQYDGSLGAHVCVHTLTQGMVGAWVGNPPDSPRVLLSKTHSMSRAGRGRPGSVHPACPLYILQGCLLSSALPLLKFQNPFRNGQHSKHPPTPQPQQKTLRTYLFWVVVVYFKDLEESLL